MAASVLIAEDEPSIVEALSFILNREGYDVATVMDGETAIQRLRNRRPDIMILDVMLPKKNGFEVLKAARADSKIVRFPIIMLTAKGQSHDRKVAEEMGIDLFLTKPFSNKEIVAKVKELLDA